MHPEFAPIAFLAAFSLALALPWHWRARNVATLSIIFWLFAVNFIFAVDAIIWRGSIDVTALVWCDITTKIIIGSNFALPAACLCICIHLEQVSSVRMVRTTLADKRRRQVFEALMCFGLPLVFMALHYIVQGHRFDIIEDYGCRPATYLSLASVFIVWVPPMVLAVASLVFAGLSLRHFMLRRISFAAHLDATHSALTTSRYLRLMLMAVLQMVWSLTITAYVLWFTLMAVPLRPWTTWADVHSNFSRVDTYPTLFIPQRVLTSYAVSWWMLPASTAIFVAFFAFGREALDEYTACFNSLRRVVLRRRGAPAALPSSPMSSKPAVSIALPRFGRKAEEASLPSYAPSSPSSTKYRSDMTDADDDARSDMSSAFAAPLAYAPPARPFTYPSSDASHRGIPST